ncbi:hypothetical protein [Ruminococcus bovis]|uniref:Uncharacterized protein n=1 Tax=Ruminococcus bovis TaxID=2564099 RepID=A0A4P8XZ65_9FIRM|nr:hypothetical protein [Ruminococcus bovis]QCT07400.1 hypothetical protein E5Z56_08570 [Ruminococcus bovis]
MEIILANEQSKLNNSNINISINTLSIYEKYIIYIVYLHECRIDKNLLYLLCYQVINNHSLIEYFKSKNLEELIANLLNKNILKIDNNTFLSIHDSIKYELDKVKYDPILFCAYASIKRYYFEKLSKTNDFSILEQLLCNRQIILKNPCEFVLAGISTYVSNFNFALLWCIPRQ